MENEGKTHTNTQINEFVEEEKSENWIQTRLNTIQKPCNTCISIEKLYSYNNRLCARLINFNVQFSCEESIMRRKGGWQQCICLSVVSSRHSFSLFVLFNYLIFRSFVRSFDSIQFSIKCTALVFLIRLVIITICILFFCYFTLGTVHFFR